MKLKEFFINNFTNINTIKDLEEIQRIYNDTYDECCDALNKLALSTMQNTELQHQLDSFKLVAKGEVIDMFKEYCCHSYIMEFLKNKPDVDLERYEGTEIEIYIKEIGKE
jgi:hypothetical protein